MPLFCGIAAPTEHYEANEDLVTVLAPSTRGDRADKPSTAPNRQAQGLAARPGACPRRSRHVVAKVVFDAANRMRI